ncbi:Lrp/AsnC family transcriptional regulator [Massilia sp. TS11]|uniref:Lrp/AsnC family transcriptional regulator n=1 Tax=Massilia sp. TS11 TaxID=2908003 RepID=UPI001EDBF380|nr:Lrp/AsnC family transcriptional regulator [Massilia sp. TS11]MCG2582987.1 Lrp/AsnC family transcriptional regulator [Massilia sp. TS11]
MEDFSFDAASRKILAELQQNCRLSNAELAEKVGLSATPCWRRQKELEDSGVIQRYAAIVNRRKLGLMVCCLAHVTLNRHAAGVVESFENAMLVRPEVVECYETTGNSDYTIKVIVPDMEAYQAFMHNVLFKLQGVAQVNTSVALREVKYQTALPV